MITKKYGAVAAQSTNDANDIGLKASHISIMSVFEHQRLSVQNFARRSDFDWLLAQEFAVFTIKRQHGQWQLKVGHYIGVIMLPSGITLEILPKLVAGMSNRGMSNTRTSNHNHAQQENDLSRTRQWVQQMLTDLTATANNSKLPHTKNLGQLSPHLALLATQTPPLSQWFVTQFLRLLSGYQPTTEYQTHRRNQSMLQGKLLIKEQLRRNSHQPHKFVSEISQLSQDTLANRLIKSALLLVQQLAGSQYGYGVQSALWSAAVVPWRQVVAFSQYELKQLEALYLRAKRQLDSQPLARSQRHSAHQLLDLAYWLLQVQQSSTATGSSISKQQPPEFATRNHSPLRLCLLINMNQAFEQWATQRVAALFAQVLVDGKPRYQTFCQSREVWLSDESGQACLSMQPDLLVYDTAASSDTLDTGDIVNHKPYNHKTYNHKTPIHRAAEKRHCSHVIDIKWKYLSHSRDISASDAYQLTSYAQAYQAQQVWLVYPVTDSTHQAVALRQPLQSELSNHATLWLMPFNILTGRLNSDLPKDFNIV